MAVATPFLSSSSSLPSSSSCSFFPPAALAGVCLLSPRSSSVKCLFYQKRGTQLVQWETAPCQLEKWRAGISFFPSFSVKKRKDPEDLKMELLDAIAPLDRGAEASEEDTERIDQLARELESVNSIKEPLKSEFLNGKWELLYTTSKSILQSQRPKFLRPNGKIYQAINVDTLRAQNMETWPYFNQVTANLVPLNSRRVAVKFDTFKIFGLISIKAPGRGRGELEITYLDEELRCRGNLCSHINDTGMQTVQKIDLTVGL